MGQYQSSQAKAAEAQDAVNQLKQKAGDVYDSVTTEGAKALRSAGETAESAIDSTKRFVQAQPVLAIGSVVAFACVVGALWKLSSSRRQDALIDRVSNYVEPGVRALRRHIG